MSVELGFLQVVGIGRNQSGFFFRRVDIIDNCLVGLEILHYLIRSSGAIQFGNIVYFIVLDRVILILLRFESCDNLSPSCFAAVQQIFNNFSIETRFLILNIVDRTRQAPRVRIDIDLIVFVIKRDAGEYGQDAVPAEQFHLVDH